jgi:hydroxyethylthiazole kinase
MHVLASNRLGSELPDRAADILARLRRRQPRIHCLTNSVAQNFTANMLLAVGAVPSMTIAPEEIAEFVRRSDALLVNLGTLDPARREAAETAARVAVEERLAWVLDPVFVDRSTFRSDFAGKLLARAPKAMRLNGLEFEALTRMNSGEQALKSCARDRLCVVALTGTTDIVTDGTRLAQIENGDPLMGRVTAMGCAATALVTACLAVEADAWLATTAGLLAFALAGECAAARARGPGSFSIEMLDALANLDRETLLSRARVR